MKTFVELVTKNPKALRKFLVALGAALGVFASAVTDNTVTTTEWIQVSIAFLGGLGVYVVPNDDS